MEDWSIVYKSTIISRAEIVKGVLIDREIEAVIINKKDTTLHLNNGQIEVLVQKKNVIDAMKIINDEITFG